MQFSIQNVHTDTLCITVYDRDLFSPNGKTTVEFSETCPCNSIYRMSTLNGKTTVVLSRIKDVLGWV